MQLHLHGEVLDYERSLAFDAEFGLGLTSLKTEELSLLTLRKVENFVGILVSCECRILKLK